MKGGIDFEKAYRYLDGNDCCARKKRRSLRARAKLAFVRQFMPWAFSGPKPLRDWIIAQVMFRIARARITEEWERK
jgi:hypothetical protein